MNCTEANRVDLVAILSVLGFRPGKVRGADYWYLSPLREESVPSFKIDSRKNVWFDHGLGRGGGLIQFLMEYFGCAVSAALKHLEDLAVGPQMPPRRGDVTRDIRKNLPRTAAVASENKIRITGIKPGIVSPVLNQYLKQRRIDRSVTAKYTHEVQFEIGKDPRSHRAIGFKNSAGGFELRNEFFKISNTPKSVTFFDNHSERLAVFEGFFDFLSYQSIFRDYPESRISFLVLNSLAFFEQHLSLMARFSVVHLYLDQDRAGRKVTTEALGKADRFRDESRLYNGYKDLNEWMINFGKLEREKSIRYKMYRNF